MEKNETPTKFYLVVVFSTEVDLYARLETHARPNTQLHIASIVRLSNTMQVITELLFFNEKEREREQGFFTISESSTYKIVHRKKWSISSGEPYNTRANLCKIWKISLYFSYVIVKHDDENRKCYCCREFLCTVSSFCLLPGGTKSFPSAISSTFRRYRRTYLQGPFIHFFPYNLFVLQ